MSSSVRMARPTARFVEITPAQASDWLQKFNHHNRAMSDTTVKRYARLQERKLTKLVWAIGEEFPTLVGTYTADPTAA